MEGVLRYLQSVVTLSAPELEQALRACPSLLSVDPAKRLHPVVDFLGFLGLQPPEVRKQHSLHHEAVA